MKKWILINDKRKESSIYLNIKQISWCSFGGYYNEDWQSEVLECEICLSNGQILESDGPQESLFLLRQYVAGEG